VDKGIGRNLYLASVELGIHSLAVALGIEGPSVVVEKATHSAEALRTGYNQLEAVAEDNSIVVVDKNWLHTAVVD